MLKSWWHTGSSLVGVHGPPLFERKKRKNYDIFWDLTAPQLEKKHGPQKFQNADDGIQLRNGKKLMVSNWCQFHGIWCNSKSQPNQFRYFIFRQKQRQLLWQNFSFNWKKIISSFFMIYSKKSYLWTNITS